MLQSSKKLISGFALGSIENDFENLIAHCEFSQGSLQNEKTRFEEYVKKISKDMDDEELAEFSNFYEADFWRISDTYPSLQWMSTFLLAYGLFESRLNHVCRVAGRKLSIKLTLRDIAGLGIERAKTYLSKGCGISDPFTHSSWHRITELAAIRNAVVHASGELDLTNDQHIQAFKVAQKDSTIVIKYHNNSQKIASIELTAEFNFHAIQTFRSFICMLCDISIA